MLSIHTHTRPSGFTIDGMVLMDPVVLLGEGEVGERQQ
jgi:hypothetical protein